jgi:hypothetical protein
MFNIDTGSNGNGGSEGPFVAWASRESLDGEIPGRTFSIRDADGKRVFSAFEKGVVLDVFNMKTGWCYSTGQKGTAPEWKWNASLSKFEPQPVSHSDEHRWQKGFSIPLAYGKEDRAVWEQAQAGAFQGFTQLVGLLKTANPDGTKLPVVKMKGTTKIESKRGITHAPEFEILKWVDRPAALAASAPDAKKEEVADEDLPF